MCVIFTDYVYKKKKKKKKKKNNNNNNNNNNKHLYLFITIIIILMNKPDCRIEQLKELSICGFIMNLANLS